MFSASNVFKMAETNAFWLTFTNVLFERAFSLVDHFPGQYSSLNLIGVT